MKRLAAAGTFTLLAGGATLILVASILYSCRQGGDPHNPRPDARSAAPSSSPPVVMHERAAPSPDARRVPVRPRL
jgi:hypothetical protein